MFDGGGRLQPRPPLRVINVYPVFLQLSHTRNIFFGRGVLAEIAAGTSLAHATSCPHHPFTWESPGEIHSVGFWGKLGRSSEGW